jgi:hypothetical protein
MRLDDETLAEVRTVCGEVLSEAGPRATAELEDLARVLTLATDRRPNPDAMRKLEPECLIDIETQSSLPLIYGNGTFRDQDKYADGTTGGIVIRKVILEDYKVSPADLAEQFQSYEVGAVLAARKVRLDMSLDAAMKRAKGEYFSYRWKLREDNVLRQCHGAPSPGSG